MITWKFHMIDMVTVIQMIITVMIWMLVNTYNTLIMSHLHLVLMKQIIINHIWNIIGIIHHNISNQHILLVMVQILV